MESPNHKLKEILDRLSVESWQLELVVSGFAVFLTGSSLEPIYNYGSRLRVISDGINSDFEFLIIFASILLACVSFIFLNLILHIIFRGMWISALGLRSISGEIDFEELKFIRPFDKFMRRKLKSFDTFIQRLEDISSVIFAFTFLIVFMVISLGLFSFFIGVIAYVINTLDSEVYEIVGLIILMIIFLGGVLYFLDFITLGFFKKKRWIAIWYYPVYRFFSIITFSWLYRPLYYNLIDNKFGRRIGFFLVPYFLLITSLATMRASLNLYIPEDKAGFEIEDRYFADARAEKSRIGNISIPSKFVERGFLDLFLVYQARNDDQAVKYLCPDLKPDKTSGIETTIVMINSDNEEAHSPADSLLNCIAEIYKIYINDSLYQDLDYYFYLDKQYKQEGIKTIIDLSHLERGKQTLRIDRLKYNNFRDTIGNFERFAQTPIWLE